VTHRLVGGQSVDARRQRVHDPSLLGILKLVCSDHAAGNRRKDDEHDPAEDRLLAVLGAPAPGLVMRDVLLMSAPLVVRDRVITLVSGRRDVAAAGGPTG